MADQCVDRKQEQGFQQGAPGDHNQFDGTCLNTDQARADIASDVVRTRFHSLWRSVPNLALIAGAFYAEYPWLESLLGGGGSGRPGHN